MVVLSLVSMSGLLSEGWLLNAKPLGKGAGYCGGAAGDVQLVVDVLQVDTHGSLGNPEAAGDLGIGVPGGDQVQQFLLPRGQPGDRVAAPLGVEVGLVQVRAQQCEDRPVPVGEVRPGPAEKVQPDGPAGPGARPRGIGQAQLKLVLDSLRPENIGVHAGAVPLPRGVEVRGFDDAAQVAGALGIAAELAVPVAGPEALPERRVRVPVPVLECLEFVGAWNRDRLQDRIRLPPAVLLMRQPTAGMACTEWKN